MASAEDKIAADTQFNGNLALTTDGEYAIAEKGWEDFLKKYPGNSQYSYAKHYLGICKCNTQHFEEAEKIFEEELREGKFPFQDEVLYYLGITFVQHAQTFPIKPTGSRQGSVNTVVDRSYSVSEDAKALFRRAVNQFRTLRNQYPESKFLTQAIYYEAIAFIQLENYQSAKDDLNYVITDPNFSDLNLALFTLADVYINLKVPEEKEALATLKKLLENKPEPELRLRAKRLLADVYFLMGDYAKAEKQLAGILNDKTFQKWLDPKTEVTSVLNLAFYYYRFGETCVKLKEYDRAAEYFGKIAADFPNSSVLPHALYQQGLAMKNFNAQLKPDEGNKAFDEEKCVELWQKVLEIPSVHSDRVLFRSTTHQLALLFLQMGEAEKALNAIKKIPEDLWTSSLHRDYADALKADGRTDEAIAAYHKIFEKNQSPKNLLNGADAMLQIIQIYHKEKDWAGIINVSSEVINFDNDQNPDKRAHLPEVMRMSFFEENAQAYYETGDYRAALKGWEYLLKDFSKYGDPDSWRVSIVY
ncbi:MAG: tetratricopeptide repeat protein, partial [Thermoguttaceae bacterium]|nr:tetratricopeptide repeat protein [Thermoguttaceae bacterium]